MTLTQKCQKFLAIYPYPMITVDCRVQFNNLGFDLITGILHGKSKRDIHNHLIL